MFPNTVGLQTTSNSAARAVAGGVFPKRLGVQVLQGTTEGAPFPRGMGVHTASKCIPITTAQAAEGDPFPKGMGVQTSGKGIPTTMNYVISLCWLEIMCSHFDSNQVSNKDENL